MASSEGTVEIGSENEDDDKEGKGDEHDSDGGDENERDENEDEPDDGAEDERKKDENGSNGVSVGVPDGDSGVGEEASAGDGEL